MITARGATLFQKGKPVPTRVFKTQRGRITLTDEKLIYEAKREPQVSVTRADITEVRLIAHANWFSRTWTEVRMHHRGGVLSISYVGQRTARALQAALGF
jgi:hypothetical protein